MGKRGPKPKGKVSLVWSPDLAYAIGLLVTDGSLSKDGRHIVFTSKDKEQIGNFMRALKIENVIGSTASGYTENRALRVQFGDVIFYRFLLDIGLMPNKSKVINKIKIPSIFFFDFLRGVFDGDGSIYSYMDKRWRSSFMYYVSFASASPEFIQWLQVVIESHLHFRGHITSAKGHATLQLKYAKADSLKLMRRMYASKRSIHLSRKRLNVERILGTVGEQL